MTTFEQKTTSEEELDEQFEVEKYKKYFDILRKNDAPMINNLLGLDELALGLPKEKFIISYNERSPKIEIRSNFPIDNKEEAIEEFKKKINDVIKSWMVIKSIYDKINPSEQDENTGKTILEVTKQLVNSFHALFIPVTQQLLKNPESPIAIPSELFQLRNSILENAYLYGDLPAVKAYDGVGTIDMIPDTIGGDEWFRTGKPTRPEWFKKWFGSEQ